MSRGKGNVLRQIAVILLLTIIIPGTVSGCQRSHYIENQAYALIMGIDITDEGYWELSVKIPSINSGSGKEGGAEQKSNSQYQNFSALGESFNEALMIINMGIPRDLNLSVLTLIVISEEIAFSQNMPELLSKLANNYDLYSSTCIAICEGDAGDFVGRQEIVIGKNLSEGITSRLQNASEIGYTPKSRLADMYYDTMSIYSDPMAILCAVADENQQLQPGDTTTSGLPVESENKNIFMGAALMKDGVAVGKLSGMQTIYVHLLRGDVEGFAYVIDGISIQLAALSNPFVTVDTSDEIPKIKIKLRYSAMCTTQVPDVQMLKAELEAEIGKTIEACQKLSVEPFGFAKLVAADFFTIDSWRNYDWNNVFSKADIDLEIDITALIN